jgi:hypothetical protein
LFAVVCQEPIFNSWSSSEFVKPGKSTVRPDTEQERIDCSVCGSLTGKAQHDQVALSSINKFDDDEKIRPIAPHRALGIRHFPFAADNIRA